MSITKQPNNTYTWTCAIDADYHRQTIRPGLYACIGIAGFLLIFGGLLSWQYHDLENFWIVAACTAVFLLITVLCFGFAFSIKDPYESYELSDIYVKIGIGKSSVYYDFKKIRQVSFYPKYIEVRGKIRRARIYAQAGEDMEFVKRHIKNRLTGDTEIRYMAHGDGSL